MISDQVNLGRQFVVGGRKWTVTEDWETSAWTVSSECGTYKATADLTDTMDEQIADIMGKIGPWIHALGEQVGAERMAQALRPQTGTEIWAAADVLEAVERLASSKLGSDDRFQAGYLAAVVASSPETAPSFLRDAVAAVQAKRQAGEEVAA